MSNGTAAGMAPPGASPKATLRYGQDTQDALDSVTATLVAERSGPSALAPVELDETVDASQIVPAANVTSAPSVTATARVTVLPRRRSPDDSTAPHVPLRPRFDRVRVLGQGAMGDVELARDNDIRRTVALKRVRDDAASEAALLRFADEVRIVGQLEHPSIVPIYDVGRDENGKVYLVMKHLNGETMEQIIQKLEAGDAEHRDKYTIAYRVHLFLGVLDAIRYAHARGIIHRDLKPANIMIGPFGEVTVLDWGIAKPIGRRDEAAASSVAETVVDSHDARLLETRPGALAGTPLYMSPEQAAGKIDEIDQRSDVYALCIVLYEWLVLAHPLAHHTSVPEVLASIIARDYTFAELRDAAIEARVPMEYIQLLFKGLQRDRAARYQSVAELEDAIKQILAGRVRIQCHVTLAKRASHAFSEWIDRHVMAYTVLFLAVIVSALGTVALGVVAAARALLHAG